VAVATLREQARLYAARRRFAMIFCMFFAVVDFFWVFGAECGFALAAMAGAVGTVAAVATVATVAAVAAVAVTVVAQPKFLRDGAATLAFPAAPPQRRLNLAPRACSCRAARLQSAPRY